MSQTLALLHTSAVFLTVETMMKELFEEILPGVKLINIMDDSLLPHCMQEQRISPPVVRRMCAYVVAAEIAGADAVLSLCSSLGPTIDVARPLVAIPVLKIDDAHTAEAARLGGRVGVMATVPTTLPPTVALVRQKASAAGTVVDVEEVLVPAAFETLMAGDRDRHDELVIDAARALAPRVDRLLFAQASMTRLAPAVERSTGRQVLTSPRMAIEHARDVLASLPRA